MMKTGSKRRRTKAEIKQAEKEKLDKENEIRSKFARLNDVERELEHT